MKKLILVSAIMISFAAGAFAQSTDTEQTRITSYNVCYTKLLRFYRKHNRYVRALSGKQKRALLMLGILEIITTSFFYLSIQIIPDPAVTGFMGNLYPVILTVMGVVFLKEKS